MQSNKKLAGIWVDHTNAWIVRYDKGIETISMLESQIESRVRETGGSNEARIPHHKLENRRFEQEKQFYHQIVSKIGDVDELVLMGPGNAKSELKRYASKNKSLGEKIRDTIPADHMTDRQIAAKVRDFFHLGNDIASSAKATG